MFGGLNLGGISLKGFSQTEKNTNSSYPLADDDLILLWLPRTKQRGVFFSCFPFENSARFLIEVG